MDDDLWTRLERIAAIDDDSCACVLTGDRSCGRHVGPTMPQPAASGSARTAPRGAWRAAVVATIVLATCSGGFAAARATSPSGGAANVAGAARPVSLGVVVEAAPPAALRDAPGVDLPPMSLSTPARLGLLLAAVGCMVGGLGLGLTRRDRPDRQRRVRPWKDTVAPTR